MIWEVIRVSYSIQLGRREEWLIALVGVFIFLLISFCAMRALHRRYSTRQSRSDQIVQDFYGEEGNSDER